jgi:hypothetical protein
LVSVAVGHTAQPQPKEANFEGKSVSAWASELKARNVPSRIAAAKALEKMGPMAKSAYPDLVKAWKERTCELWLVFVREKDHDRTRKISDMVANAIGQTQEKLTPAQENERLKAQVESLQNELNAVERFFMSDEYVLAILKAMTSIDKEESVRLFNEPSMAVPPSFMIGPNVRHLLEDKAGSKK